MEEFLEQDEDRKELFSRQFQYDISYKMVSCYDVVEKFLAANITSNDEKKSLTEVKVADKKIKRLIEILTQHYHRKNLQPFKTFIEILEETKNIPLAKQLSLIYGERENSLGILNRLEKEKSLVANLQREISRLQLILEDREFTLTNLRQEKRGLADRLHQIEKDKKEAIIKIKREFESKVRQKEQFICTVGKELKELTTLKQDLENEVRSKTIIIDNSEKEMNDMEDKLQNAIRESNKLRSEIEKLRQNFVQVMGKEKDEMSRKIETLEDEIVAKENKIEDLRRNQTLTRGEVEEELRKITKVQEEKIEELVNSSKQQDKKMDNLLEDNRRQNQNIEKIMKILMENKQN